MQVHPVVKKVYNALKEYIPQGACLLLAVSGGADSMALLSCLLSMKDEYALYSRKLKGRCHHIP